VIEDFRDRRHTGATRLFTASCKTVHEQEMSAYRGIEAQFGPITAEEEVAVIEEALNLAGSLRPRACKRAGLVGRLLHDLRRTAARDFRRAGVSEGEIMRLCGWETRSMFDRYKMIDKADLAAAVAKRFNGKVTAKSEGFVEQVK
jgi:hypothetical protein